MAHGELANPLFNVPTEARPKTHDGIALVYGPGAHIFVGRIHTGGVAQVANRSGGTRDSHHGWCEYPGWGQI